MTTAFADIQRGFDSGFLIEGNHLENFFGWSCLIIFAGKSIDRRAFCILIILPDHLFSNLEKAYSSYCKETPEVCEAADEYFYNHEQEVIDILQKHADQFAL